MYQIIMVAKILLSNLLQCFLPFSFISVMCETYPTTAKNPSSILNLFSIKYNIVLFYDEILVIMLCGSVFDTANAVLLKDLPPHRVHQIWVCEYWLTLK